MTDDLLTILWRSVVVGSIVLSVSYLVATTALRHRPALRHLVLHAALLVYLLGPLWVLTARGLPTAAREVMRPAVGALAFLDPGSPTDLAPSEAAGAPGPLIPQGNAHTARPDGATWLALWTLGAALLLLRLGRGWAQVRQMRRAASALPEDLARWAQATLRRRFPGRTPPSILLSNATGSPLVLGVLSPAIVLPPSALNLARESLEHVLVHEMAHVIRGDLRVGLSQRLIGALHWPNPLVHLCRRALERAQEESCDDLVLSAAPPSAYARTLLAVATSEAPTIPAGAVGMAVGPSELERRIRRLLAHPATPPTDRSPTTRLPRLAKPSALLAATMLITALGGATAIASAVTLTTPPRRLAEDEEVRGLFREAGASVEGAFVLVDVDGGEVRTINPGLAAARFTPVSTYKVIIAIAALETGVVSDEGTSLKWDGRLHPIEAWNRDLDLQAAMKSSSNWYFQEIFQRVGEARMQAWVQKLRYGTPGPPLGIPTWMDGGLALSAVEQAEFFARFASGRLPVSPRTQEILRRILLVEERDGVALRAKTGTATLGTGGTLGWLTGTVEQPGRRFAFATFFRGSQADGKGIIARRHAITRRLLARWNALPPEMAP